MTIREGKLRDQARRSQRFHVSAIPETSKGRDWKNRMAAIKLYGAVPSSNSDRVKIALHEKGLAYERVTQD
jgi:hypothetical protein